MRVACPRPAGTQALSARGHNAHRPILSRQSVPPEQRSPGQHARGDRPGGRCSRDHRVPALRGERGGPTKYRFTSQELDAETGLYYYGARYYNPALARFVSPDPIEMRLEDPQTLNRYAYARNNPVFYNDPSGYEEQDPAVPLSPSDYHLPIAADLADAIEASPVGSFMEAQRASLASDRQQMVSGTVIDIPTLMLGTYDALIGVLRFPSRTVAGANSDEPLSTTIGALQDVRDVAFVVSTAVLGARVSAAVGAPKLLPAPTGVNPWAGSLLSTTAAENLTMYRVWGGDSAQVGSWLTPVRPTSAGAARAGLALPKGNAATLVSEVTVHGWNAVSDWHRRPRVWPTWRCRSSSVAGSDPREFDMDQELYGGAMRVRNGALEAVGTDGSVLWRWCPPAARVIGLLAVPGRGDAIALAEPIASLPRGVSTLFRCRSDGAIVWAVEVPPGGDGTYVTATVSGDEVRANTWDGRRVVIDIDTGRIKGVAFVK